MHTERFDWDLVRAFLAALEHGSLLGAARALGSSQPTLGRQIGALEVQLGTVLFERTGRGLLPTQAALQLADAARAMQAGADALARAASGGTAAVSGTVRISASQPVACHVLPPVLAQMRQVLPEVQVELVASNAVSNLLRREADIAVTLSAPREGRMVARKLTDYGLSLYAAPSYLDARPPIRTRADMADHRFIGYIGDLRTMTSGRGQFSMEFSHYAPCPKNVSDDVIAKAKAREEAARN